MTGISFRWLGHRRCPESSLIGAGTVASILGSICGSARGGNGLSGSIGKICVLNIGFTAKSTPVHTFLIVGLF